MNQRNHSSTPPNRLLAALPRDDYDRILPKLEVARFPRNRIVYEVGDPMQHGYFLTSGLVCLLAITEAGETIDVGMVAKEGFIGVPIILNSSTTPCRVITQLPCEVLRIKREQLLAEFNRGGKFQKLLLSYTQAQQVQLIQSAVCHSLHTIRQRLGRWLLVVSDCVQSDSFDVTQEHIANMLGHQRNRITLAARELFQEGLINYGGGSMKIVNRSGMEAAACECYQIVKESVTQFL